MRSLFPAGRIYCALNKSKVEAPKAMGDFEHNSPDPQPYPTDTGQIGAIIQARLDNTKNVNDRLWCHLGSLCFTRLIEPQPVSTYRENGNGQRRRIDDDEKLMIVTPDQTRKKNRDKIEFVGVSLSDIPCSPRLESTAYKFPDACGRVAIQISGIATVPVAPNAMDDVQDLKIGDCVSINVNEVMEFSEHEQSVAIKKSDAGDDPMHYIGTICNMNLSPVTGPSVDILLCPHRFTKKMNGANIEINLERISSEFLNDLWARFQDAANAETGRPHADLIRNINGNETLSLAQRNELVSIINEYQTDTDAKIICPDAGEVSFFGKLIFFFGIDEDEYMPGFADALFHGEEFNVTAQSIKAKITGEIYDTEFTRILCKTSEELMWIKAWEDWANERPAPLRLTYNVKLNALKEYIRSTGR